MNKADEKWVPPEFIYLQVGEDFDPKFDVGVSNEMTWWSERIYKTDIKYRLVEEEE